MVVILVDGDDDMSGVRMNEWIAAALHSHQQRTTNDLGDPSVSRVQD